MTFRRSLGTVALGCIAALAVAGASWAQKYGATATVAKGVDVSTFRTYTWTPGRPSPDKGMDRLIVAAVDKELAGVGLKKADGATPDVLATYYSVSRTDVDVNAKPDEKGLRPERTVGSLVVALLDPVKRKPLVQLRIDKPIDRANVEGSINALVTELFTKYPKGASK